MVLRDRYLPVRSRCLHPGQQQGRRWPSSSSSWVRRMRRSRVLACLASSTQQMNSLRAKGVMFLPDIECRGVGDQRLTQVRGQLMHHPTGQSAAAHRPMVLSRRQAGSPPACGTPSRRTLPPRGTCFRRPTSIRRRSRADLVCAETVHVDDDRFYDRGGVNRATPSATKGSARIEPDRRCRGRSDSPTRRRSLGARAAAFQVSVSGAATTCSLAT